MKKIAAIVPDKSQAANQQYLQSSKNSSKKSASELFSAISSRIRVLSNDTISEAESREAARRFISFCQLVVDYKLKQSMKLKDRDRATEKLQFQHKATIKPSKSGKNAE